jgi:hypothetical protein
MRLLAFNSVCGGPALAHGIGLLPAGLVHAVPWESISVRGGFGSDFRVTCDSVVTLNHCRNCGGRLSAVTPVNPSTTTVLLANLVHLRGTNKPDASAGLSPGECLARILRGSGGAAQPRRPRRQMCRASGHAAWPWTAVPRQVSQCPRHRKGNKSAELARPQKAAMPHAAGNTVRSQTC